ncbi:MAG: apolipoprotein N-acyltransferase [Synechococcus sp.]
MGNDRSLAWLQGIAGGALAGLALSAPRWCPSGPWLMIPALALLWSAARRPVAAAGWGGGAVLVSHRWLLGLHPLMWIGVPAPLSLPVAMGLWMTCAAAAAALVTSWALLAHWCQRSRWSTALLMACLWGLGEVALAQGPLFWIGVGGSVLPADPLLAGWARWIGAGGLAALQLLGGWWLWRLLQLAPPQRNTWMAMGLSALIAVHGWGWWVIRPVDPQPPTALRLGLWQPALPTREKFSATQQQRLPGRLQNALDRAAQHHADGLVAPEGTLPLQGQLLKPAPLPLLTGGFRWQRGHQRSSLLLVESDAQRPSAAIDKHRLVPLGEWIPLWLGSTAGLSAVGGLEPGEASRFWPWPGPAAAVAICYELSDGTAMARAVANGAEWLLAIANLDPYPELLQRQFLALAQLRSVETDRPLVSAANTGPTAMVSARGTVQQRLQAMQPGLMISNLVPRHGLTPYVRWGEGPLWIMVMAMVVVRVSQRGAGSIHPPAPVPRRKTRPPDRE